MEKIVNILMRRDGLSREEALDRAREVREMILDAAAAGNECEAEDILLDELGLEIDYLLDLVLDA